MSGVELSKKVCTYVGPGVAAWSMYGVGEFAEICFREVYREPGTTGKSVTEAVHPDLEHMCPTEYLLQHPAT